MRHREIHIKQSHKLRMRSDHLSDRLPRERLLPKSPLDRTEDFSVCGILLVEELTEGVVGRAEAVEEVLGEDPAAVCCMSWMEGGGGCVLEKAYKDEMEGNNTHKHK